MHFHEMIVNLITLFPKDIIAAFPRQNFHSIPGTAQEVLTAERGPGPVLL